MPLRLEILEYDQLDSMIDGQLPNGNIARRGIELDKATGRPVAYHFLKEHPGDYLSRSGYYGESVPYDAADIIHVWDRRWISQYSGMSWLAAVVMEAYSMAEYRTTEQQGAEQPLPLPLSSNQPFQGFRSSQKRREISGKTISVIDQRWSARS